MRFVTISPIYIKEYIALDSQESTSIQEIANQYGLGLNDIKLFLSIQNEKTILFNGWIETDLQLKSLLENEKTLGKFTDSRGLKKHLLFSEFQQYLNLFFPVFKPFDDLNLELLHYLSYASLLSPGDWIDKESSAMAFFTKDIEDEIQLIRAIKDTKRFNSKLSALFNNDLISIFNLLSAESSYIKVIYIENAITLLKDERCSINTTGYILKQLNELKLNAIQKEVIEKAFDQFRGRGLKKQQKSKRPSGRAMLYFFFLIGGVFAIYYIFISLNQSDLQKQIGVSSSLQFFNKTERIKIDSIFKRNKITQEPVDNSLYNSGTGYDIQIRQAFINKKAEHLYQKLDFGLSEYYLNPEAPCHANGQFKREIKNTKSIIKSQGSKNIEFKNESDYTILILCFQDKKEEPVFSTRLHRGKTIKATLNDGCLFFFLPGDKSVDSQSQPFCQIDFNYDHGFSSPYVFASIQKESKVIFEGLKGESVEFNDPQGAFSLH